MEDTKYGVMISIQPQHVKNIIEERKTVELRTRIPKLPCKMFIYCTKSDNQTLIYNGYETYLLKGRMKKLVIGGGNIGNGKVVGEFNVNKAVEITPKSTNTEKSLILAASCVSKEDFNKYVEEKGKIYALIIEDLKIYEKPMELGQFTHCDCREMPYCPLCSKGGEFMSESEEEYCQETGSRGGCTTEWWCGNWMKKAPQSWCYCMKGGRL